MTPKVGPFEPEDRKKKKIRPQSGKLIQSVSIFTPPLADPSTPKKKKKKKDKDESRSQSEPRPSEGKNYLRTHSLRSNKEKKKVKFWTKICLNKEASIF